MESSSPHIVEGFVEVTGHLLGRSLIDFLRQNLITSCQVEQGDEFMDRSTVLLEQHLQLIELELQTQIRLHYMTARDIKEELDDMNGSAAKKFFQARKYKKHARKMFKITRRASDRARGDRLMDQIAEATGGLESGPGNNADTGSVASTPRDPFTDSHAISTLTNVSVNDLDQVEMSTFQNEDTGESAVVLDLHGQDSSIQHLVSTFPTEAFSGDRTNGEATVAFSLHQEDGSTPRLVIEPLHNVSPCQSTSGEAETGPIPTEAVVSSEAYDS